MKEGEEEGAPPPSVREPRKGEWRREEEVVPAADDMRMGLDQQLTEVGREVMARSAPSVG